MLKLCYFVPQTSSVLFPVVLTLEEVIVQVHEASPLLLPDLLKFADGRLSKAPQRRAPVLQLQL